MLKASWWSVVREVNLKLRGIRGAGGGGSGLGEGGEGDGGLEGGGLEKSAEARGPDWEKKTETLMSIPSYFKPS